MQRTCSTPDCDKGHEARGLCKAHYSKRWKALRTVTCSISNCSKVEFARGWCKRHYDRWLVHGTTDDPRRSVLERFVAKIAFGECWEWRGGLSPEGYGR